jgi:hypothetical protein
MDSSPKTGGCYFCGSPTSIIRTVRRAAADTIYARVSPKQSFRACECFVCTDCGGDGAGPVVLTPDVTWKIKR